MRPTHAVLALLGAAFMAHGSETAPPTLDRISIEPAGELALVGKGARQQVVITGHYTDGSVRDLTAAATLSHDDGVIRTQGSVVHAINNGAARLSVRIGAVAAECRVVVRDADQPQPFSFQNNVMAVLSRAGCNMGTCHGNFNGKNGFRLSLRGDSAAFDLDSLARDMHGRRIDRLAPDNSLLLRKATGQLPHEGGVRFGVGSLEYRSLRRWIAEGAHADAPGTLTVSELAVWPRERFLLHGARTQQIAVRARFSDGVWRDVTHLAVFEPSSDLVNVSATGLASAQRSGEATILVRYLDQRAAVRLAFVPERAGFRWTDPPAHNFVDRLVFERLKSLQVEPSGLAEDAAFLRRAYLDVCGILPSADEARAFLLDKSPDKRARLVDRLLARPEYAEFWAMKWADVLRNEEKAVDAKGVRLFAHWLRRQVAADVPLDRFVRALLTGLGSTYENPAANYHRTNLEPTKAAETTAMVFLGVRVACARCHNHPFDRWTQEDYYGLSAFFARVKTKMADNKRRDKLDKHELVGEMIVYVDREGEVPHHVTGNPMAPRLPGGLTPRIAPDADRLGALADWVTARDNPFFARVMANRVWYHLMGRGLVDPPDDFRESNPASNEPVLAALTRELVEHGFSQKHLIRTILLSRTYQLSHKPTPTNEEDVNFSRVIPQRLQAELLVDAVSHVTESPEIFPGHPIGTRSVQLPGVAGATALLKALGRPERLLACECERATDSSLMQAILMINSESVRRKVEESPRIERWLNKKTSDHEVAEELYLSALSRYPSEREHAIARRYLTLAADRRRGLEDLMWAVVNTKEFLLRR